MKKVGQYVTDKGAHWFRCDLQVHTPRDRNWHGNDFIGDDDRRTHAAQLVRACRERGLKAIAITDHHDMAFADYVRAAAADERNADGTALAAAERLVVFPGMELTLGVPCQALLLFDASFPSDLFSLAMTALAITPSAVLDAKTALVQRLHTVQSLPVLKQKLDEH